MALSQAIIRILTLKCPEATALLSAAEDGKLAVSDRWALWLHLVVCAPCRRFRHQMGKISRAVRDGVRRIQDQGDLPGVQLSQETRDQLHKLIDMHRG
jgi:hypothetical protein